MLRKICFTASLLAMSVASVQAEELTHSSQQSESIVLPERPISSDAMSKKLGRSVSVQPIQGSNLYSVAYDDKVYFTDISGSVLINGDVVTLSDNVLISDVIKHEIRVLFEQQQQIKNSKLKSLDSFLDSDKKPHSPQASRTAQPLNQHGTPVSIPATKASVTTAVTAHDATPQIGMSSEALTAQIAKTKQKRQQLAGERQCLEKMAKANSFKELYSIFYQMDKSEKITCGKAYAASKVPFIGDEKYIVYKAENERDVITMFSDYTCHICVNDHKNIESLNAQGVTVRVAPFGRGEYKNVVLAPSGEYTYGDGYSILGQNYNALACGTNDPVERKSMFSELMSNPHKYKSGLLPQAESASTDGVCTAALMRDKFEMDMYTARGTPFYVFSDGSTVRGGMSASEIVSRLPTKEL